MNIDPANSIVLYNASSPLAKPLADEIASLIGSRHPLQSTEDGEVAVGDPAPDVLITRAFRAWDSAMPILHHSAIGPPLETRCLMCGTTTCHLFDNCGQWWS